VDVDAHKDWRRWLSAPRWRLAAAAIALIAALALWFFLRPPFYDVQATKKGEAVDVVYATGIMDHVREASIAPVVAQPIRRVFVTEGEMVQRGQLLAQLEDGPAQATAAQLAASSATARLAADRAERLFKSGFGAAAARDEAVGQYRAAEAAARSARALVSDYAIRAPFSGRVIRREAEPGDLAQPSHVMFVVADESSLRVTADLDERDIAHVEVGQGALIRADAYPDQSFDARVAEITPRGDSAARIFRVRLKPAPGTPLKAGMTVEANIIASRRPDAVLAPAAAVKDNVLWVVGHDGKVARRIIQRGAAGGDWIEIRSGASAGEQVLLNPRDDLKDGQRVRTRQKSQPGPTQ